MGDLTIVPIRIRWLVATGLALAMVCVAGPVSARAADSGVPGWARIHLDRPLVEAAMQAPRSSVEVIVRARSGVSRPQLAAAVRRHGGRVTRDLHVIRGLAARLRAVDALALARESSVLHVTANSAVRPRALRPGNLRTAFNHSIVSPDLWLKEKATGKGVGVAVIDTGIRGDLPDFRRDEDDAKSRVIASAVVNPYASTASDAYGHGTHVAGIIAGNSDFRGHGDTGLDGAYAGVAPEADLISIKVSDDAGSATILDVIYGIQFAVDFRRDLNIRVINLSLESTTPSSYRSDPLAAAVESAWFSGIVVVAAAGNRGTASDAVHYAPGNDPYIISVGAVDDRGTEGRSDDVLAAWSSRGTTQDGHVKPEINAPGARIVSNLAPGSAFAQMCPSCIVDAEYIRAGGTSMAAPMVAGAVANMLQVNSSLTPDQVKARIMEFARDLAGGIKEVHAHDAAVRKARIPSANGGLTPNDLVDPTTGQIDYTRSSWSRSSWSTAPDSLKAGWARSSWSCNCSRTSDGSIDPNRSSWSRSSWSTSWDR